MSVRKEGSRESILSACPCLPVGRRSGSRRSVQHAGAQQSKISQRSVVQVNVGIGFPAPASKQWYRIDSSVLECLTYQGTPGCDFFPLVSESVARGPILSRFP